ncbi:uncharacterized protein [Antedon mediterranea]|uniref:uncharacterized protein n=1 Tax=Antedon mediterranea TaxID=105859 RepID=UPI003AF4C517
MEFEAEKYLAECVSWEKFNTLKKPDLLALGRYFDLHLKQSTRKQVVKNKLIETLVREEYLEESCLKEVIVVEEVESEAVKLKELELQMAKMEIDKERMMMEMEMERAKQKADVELELAKLQYQIERDIIEREREGKVNVASAPNAFDASKHIRLVPKFQETEVDKYFQHFEKIAYSMKWPKEKWTLLLQSVFIGKAREIYSALPLHECSDYEIVKKAVLSAYELVPEAYRQRFRDARIQCEQTHVKFARVKEQMFDRWVSSKDVELNYDNLKQMMLIEEFKRCIHVDIKIHLDERKIDTLKDAAVYADDYALTHKLSAININNPNHEDKPRDYKRVSDTKRQSPFKSKRWDKPKVLTCYHCKKPGHVMSQCYFLKRNSSNKSFLPVGCATLKGDTNNISKVNKQIECNKTNENFAPFMSEARVSLKGDDCFKRIRVMRDTCCAQSMMLEGALSFGKSSSTSMTALIRGVGMNVINVPLHKVIIDSELVKGEAIIGVVPELPVKGIDMLLGNDLAGGRVLPELMINDNLTRTLQESNVLCETGTPDNDWEYPACAVTRAMTQKIEDRMSDNDGLDLEGTFMSNLEFYNPGEDIKKTKCDTSVNVGSGEPKSRKREPLSTEMLIKEQEDDSFIQKLGSRVLPKEEAAKLPVCFYKENNVVMRKWRPRHAQVHDVWAVVHQIVVPKVYHDDVIGIAHDNSMSGHLGVRKTHDKIIQHFWWPSLKKEVSRYCRLCHICQVVGKPNKKIPVAPLKPIPAFGEPFSKVMIDCVGPLPKTKSGNQYLLTIMCCSTRFPEAVPLRNINAATVVKALIKFFTLVGLPTSIQSDQGTNFKSGLFQQIMLQLGIEQSTSSAYHPESQGAIERFHQTLKNMLRAYCVEFQREWDEGVHLVLFAARESVQETLGFSPFQLVFGHSVLKDKWLQGELNNVNLLDYVCDFRHKLNRATVIAKAI